MKKRVSLGCGSDKPEGFVGVDIVDLPEVDVVQDLEEEKWDLPENHFVEVRAKDVFEHIEHSVTFLENIHSIAEEGAEVYIRSPHRSSQSWTDPTHERLVGIDTIKEYFTNKGDYNFYSDIRFRQEDVRITFLKSIFHPWNYLIEPIINLNSAIQGYYESSFLCRIFPAKNVEFNLEVKK